MLRSHRSMAAACAIALSLSLLTTLVTRASATTIPATQGDGLSGTWQVSRVCLTICVSPRPVLKVVRHQSGDVFMTTSHPSQVLYRMGMQVLVHSPKDSLLLTIKTPGVLMSGRGVGADGSTFQSTWRCVAPPSSPATTTITATASPMDAGGVAPLGSSGAQARRAPLGISRC